MTYIKLPMTLEYDIVLIYLPFASMFDYINENPKCVGNGVLIDLASCLPNSSRNFFKYPSCDKYRKLLFLF